MKYYNKFYEVGNNVYYTIRADDEDFIATESFINIGRRNLFGKQKKLTQGLKLLKLTAPVAVLFDSIYKAPECSKQRYDSDDLTTYVIPKNKTIINEIINTYDVFKTMQIKELEDDLKEVIGVLKENYSGEELDNKISYYTRKSEEMIQHVTESDPLSKYNLEDPTHTSGNIIKTMIREGINHLYTEKVTNFLSHTILYECDDFGTLTIYRVSTIKNVVKGIETFKYDRNVIGALIDSENNKI